MKNLGRTIDRLIKIEPSFEDGLSQIKNKWKKYPSRAQNYWEELITFLNSSNVQEHPKLFDIKNAIVSKKKTTPKKLYSFDQVSEGDHIIGGIPENLADRIKLHDRKAIEIAKQHIEATMTKDIESMADVIRKEAIQEVSLKKVWIDLKDYFSLWNKQTNVMIKTTKQGMLVLAENNPQMPPQFIGPGIVKMDSNTLQNFIKFLGMDQDPDL